MGRIIPASEACCCRQCADCAHANTISSVVANLKEGGLTNHHCDQCTSISGYYTLQNCTYWSCRCYWRYLAYLGVADVWPCYLMIDGFPYTSGSDGFWRWVLIVWTFYRWHALTPEEFVNYTHQCDPPDIGTNTGYRYYRYRSNPIAFGENCKPSGGSIGVYYERLGNAGEGATPCLGLFADELELLIT